MDTYEVETVWSTPELIGSLAEFSVSRQALPDAGAPSPPPGRARGEREASVLFLRISAAAEYFTTNATLMSDAAPVYADVILDPYLLNVLPRSLVPTVCYVLVVAAASWLVAQSVLAGIRGLVAAEEGGPSGDAKKER